MTLLALLLCLLPFVPLSIVVVLLKHVLISQIKGTPNIDPQIL